MDAKIPHRATSRRTVRHDSRRPQAGQPGPSRPAREQNDDPEAERVSEAIQYYFGL